MADGELTMFGKAYDTVGSTNKNLILLTRGDLKVRWGNKYIDLIKNGKINVDVDFIKKVDDKEGIFKDGIYIVEKDDNLEVWLYSGGTLINLIGEVGTTYVSFIGTQDVDAEKKFLALINAGFYYKTYSDAEKASIKSGLIYIDDQHQLYYAKEGKLYKYEQALTVPDPLVVGNITIDGKSSRISGGAGLSLGVGTADYISFTDKGVNVLKPLTTTDVVASDTFEHNKTGYSIYYDPIRNWHCMEIDYILVRNLIDYGGIEDILYDDLVAKVENRGLAKGKKYRITDFQNEWEIEDIYYDSENKPYYYYWPVILTAKSENEFEDYGYFCDNKKWIIKYDINYHYYINSGVNTEGNYWILYTKGRITELADEYGNVGNYDFKHRKFLLLGSENLTQRQFTFNVTNVDKGTDLKDPLSFKNIHDNWDATQIKDVKVLNNIINIKEPSFEETSITDEEGNSKIVEQAVIYDEYIIFPNCSTIYPYNNEILESSGTYVITGEFHGNKIEGLLQTILDPVKSEFKFDFYDNTFGKIYIKGDKYGNSAAVVVFADYKKFYNNTAKDVVRAIFFEDSHDNVFQNIDSCTFDALMISNTFDSDLWHTAFECNTMTNNHITGYIFTDNAKESYPIKVDNLSDNVINIIYKSALNCAGCDITNNIINNIIGYNISNSNLRDNIIKDIIGDDTGFNPNVNPNDVYSEQESSTLEQTDDNGIVTSVTIYEITWYKETPASPGSNYTLYNINYNGELFYAWLPNTITKNGTTYYLTQPASPGDGYTLNTTTLYGVTYYAWVELGTE